MSKDYGTEQLFLGVDGGGSKCKAILYCASKGILAEAISGPANLLLGTELVTRNIMDATHQAMEESGIVGLKTSDLVAGIGLAAFNLPKCEKEIAQWKPPFKKAFLTTDIHIACVGAHNGEDGGVIIVGTGTNGFASSATGKRSVGGHGFAVGDKGSGAWFGHQAVRLALEAFDGLRPKTQLFELVRDSFSVESSLELAQLATDFCPKDYAKLAPSVISIAEAGNPDASLLVQEGAQYLSQMATALIHSSDAPLPLAFVGGLSHLVIPHLSDEVRKFITETQCPPEVGAARFGQICLAEAYS